MASDSWGMMKWSDGCRQDNVKGEPQSIWKTTTIDLQVPSDSQGVPHRGLTDGGGAIRPRAWRTVRGLLKALDLHMKLHVRRERKGCAVECAKTLDIEEVVLGPSFRAQSLTVILRIYSNRILYSMS